MEKFKKVEGKPGWFLESKRHALAAKGQTTLPFFAKRRKLSRKRYLKEYKEVKRLENLLERTKREGRPPEVVLYPTDHFKTKYYLYYKHKCEKGHYHYYRKLAVDRDKILHKCSEVEKRDILTEVLDVIKDLEKELGYAKQEKIIEKTLEIRRDMKETDVDKAIEKLRLDGHIFEPKFGMYKCV